MKNYIIGVDAGGTKTTAEGYSLAGDSLGLEVGGFGNTTVDFDRGIANICETVNRLLARLGEDCAYLCVGCAGIETGDLKPRAQKLLSERYPFPVFVTNDAMLGLYAALEGQDGVLVIAGTGSIGYLKQDGALRRCGGWGHLINDDGSGYTIAVRAIRKIADAFDTGPGHEDTPLKRAVFEHLGITELRQLIDFTYRSTKGEIAALVPIVEAVANGGDPEAVEILEWAGMCLANVAVRLCTQYGYTSCPNIAVSGSVIRKTAITKRVFSRRLTAALGDYTFYDREFNPTIGGYYLYREQYPS